ncbi:hypothetical protein GCM10023331_10940 [Algivirga pacifica]|uniref:histidine kinase n=2 Tax=Algivirga pacifica TaxID=1162670 RepID=A0ABP9D973_9BACT
MPILSSCTFILGAVLSKSKLREQDKLPVSVEACAKALDTAMMVMTVNESGKITYMNKLMLNFLGYEKGKSGVLQIDDVLDAVSVNYFKQEVQLLKEEGAINLELCFRGSQQQNMWGMCTFTKSRNTQTNALEYIVLVVDISHRKKIEHVFRQQHCDLLSQKQELLNSNKAKDKFLSILAHDIKGPLNGLQGFTTLLVSYIEQLSKEDIHEMAYELRGSLDNLYKLLENLLEWSRAQNGRMELHFEEVSLKVLVDQSKALLINLSEGKQITIKNLIDEHLMVMVDVNAMATVLRNLLSNALKFSNREEVVEVSAVEEQDTVLIAVKDYGIGMPSVIKDKLFRADEKVSTPGTEQERGTGLGLLLCKEFVEKNNGTIWVDSVEGEGTTFWLRLPSARNSHKIFQQKHKKETNL